MSKLPLTPLASLTNEATALANINGDKIAITAAFDNTLSRDGTSPNPMLAPLDMNNQRIINLPAPVNPGDVVRFSDVSSGGLGLSKANLVGGNTFTGNQIINSNTTLPANPTVTNHPLRIIGADGLPVEFQMQTFGDDAVLGAFVAGGTAAAPTALAADTLILHLRALGWDGSVYGNVPPTNPAASASVALWTAENQTPGNHGSYITFETTPLGSTTKAKGVKVQPSGGVSIGASALATDPGAGSLNLNSGIALADQKNVLAITVTQPTTPTAVQSAVLWTINSAGSASFQNQGFGLVYAAGYTGSSTTSAATFLNSAAGTSTYTIPAAGSNVFSGNVVYRGFSNATTIGSNQGGNFAAGGGNLNIGAVGIAQAAKNAATNIGVAGSAINTGTTPVQVGGFFSLNQTVIPTASAAFIADNGSQTDPVFRGRVNGVDKFVIDGSGNVVITAAASVTPVNNGELVIQATSNTSLTFKYKGSDGTIRSASLTLS